MADIVEHCCVTEALPHASTQGVLDSDEEDDILNKFWSPGTRGSNAADVIPVDFCGDEYMETGKGKSKRMGHSQSDSGHSKKSRSSGFDDICAAFTAYVLAKMEQSRTRSIDTEAISANGDDYSFDVCQDALLQLGDIPPKKYVKALTLFKDKDWQRFFMRTPGHMHPSFVVVWKVSAAAVRKWLQKVSNRLSLAERCEKWGWLIGWKTPRSTGSMMDSAAAAVVKL